jgi:exodeoxyribonuclease VII small subunit
MTEQTFTFESAYARLEEILEKMNAGKVSLEDSLKLYEEADRLINWCSKQLNEAEKKIEVLVKNREGEVMLGEQGRPLTQPFAQANRS